MSDVYFFCHSCCTALPELSAPCECGGTACNCEGCLLETTILLTTKIPSANMQSDGTPGPWCDGIQRDDEIVEPVRAIGAKTVDEKVAAVPEPAASLVPFRALAKACGLTTADIEAMTGKASSVRKKSAGKLPMTSTDEAFFRGVWARIEAGDVEGLPAGCREMSWAMGTLARWHQGRQECPGEHRGVPAAG